MRYGRKLATKTWDTFTYAERSTTRSSPIHLQCSINEDALVDLHERPWFRCVSLLWCRFLHVLTLLRRLWVLQEFRSAPENTAHCGTHTVDMSDTLETAVWLRFKRRNVSSYALIQSLGLANATNMYNLLQAKNGKHLYGLAVLLTFTRHFEPVQYAVRQSLRDSRAVPTLVQKRKERINLLNLTGA